jgi:dTDP-4-dehydrorhamnose 3,5-epimerase
MGIITKNNIETIDEKIKLLTPNINKDDRGFLVETYREENLENYNFVQHNHSRSSKGIVRGLHYQSWPGQTKLVRCSRGRIFDVAVDLRKDSLTFGQWKGFFIDDENHQQVLIPEGFAHGFCVISDIADVSYLLSTYYKPEKEKSVKWDDEDININWPIPKTEIEVSERDKSAPSFKSIREKIEF